MEFFKYFLFGIAGLSLIFWVSIIAIWHVDMFPRLFRDDYKVDQLNRFSAFSKADLKLKPSGIIDRNKYSNKSFVIADFTPVESDYGVNRLYTSLLLSLGVMSFIIISYGLHSGLLALA